MDATRDIILSEVSQEKEKYHMISCVCHIYNMSQMSLSIKQKWTHGHRGQTRGCQRVKGKEEGWTGSLGLVDASYYI